MPNYAPIPEFGQLVEYITQGSLVGDTYGVVINRVKLEAIIKPPEMGGIPAGNNLPSLQSIKTDYTKVNAINPIRVPILTPFELTPVKTAIAIDYHSDVVKYATDTTPTGLVITTKLVEVIQRPVWKVGIAVVVGAVYQYTDKNLYQVIQTHTTQADWTPPVAKSLFKRFYEPTDSPWPWAQPTGAHDAYPIGAKVTYKGYTWQSNINANVWEPGSVGAETLWINLTPPPVSPNWAVGVAYKVNDQVIYVPNGFTYKCLQAHTSQAGWNPPAVPALWKKL
jgi:hypothetical protein